MKKDYSIPRIVGIALTLVFCFSTLAFSEDTYITYAGRMTKEDSFTLQAVDPEDLLPLREYSFEINVEKHIIPFPFDESLRGTFIYSVYVGLGGNCSDCGIYLKVTDPNGRVILDKSTPETGFVKINREFNTFIITDPASGELLEPVLGKHTVWLKPTANNVIHGVRIEIDGYPKQ